MSDISLGMFSTGIDRLAPRVQAELVVETDEPFCRKLGLIDLEIPAPGVRVRVGNRASSLMFRLPEAEARRAAASRTSGRRASSSAGAAAGTGGALASTGSTGRLASGSTPLPTRIS